MCVETWNAMFVGYKTRLVFNPKYLIEDQVQGVLTGYSLQNAELTCGPCTMLVYITGLDNRVAAIFSWFVTMLQTKSLDLCTND